MIKGRNFGGGSPNVNLMKFREFGLLPSGISPTSAQMKSFKIPADFEGASSNDRGGSFVETPNTIGDGLGRVKVPEGFTAPKAQPFKLAIRKMALDASSSDEGGPYVSGGRRDMRSHEGISSSPDPQNFNSSEDSKDRIKDESGNAKSLGAVRERSSPRRMENRGKSFAFKKLEETPRKDTLNSSFDMAN